MMTLLTVKKQRETTRITIGCEDHAAEVQAKLVARGYMVKAKKTYDPVVRDTAERERATKLVQEVYTH